jgi:uncharacterized protein (TIGR02266 family)
MAGREHERVPFTVRVQYRTPSSFLVAYSVNLSRGGVFLETNNPADVGSDVMLQFAVPDAGPILVSGRVAWRRSDASDEGPAGIGVEFDDMVDSLGEVIDRLVHDFAGVSVLLLCGDRQDRSSLMRMIKSIISAAEVIEAEDPTVAQKLLTEQVDLAVIDADFDPSAAIHAVRAARSCAPPLPTVVLASSKNVREKARAAGADEVTGNPPPFPEFRKLLLRALGRPALVEASP